MLPRYSGDLV